MPHPPCHLSHVVVDSAGTHAAHRSMTGTFIDVAAVLAGTAAGTLGAGLVAAL
jgi:hypothetical protein